MSTTSQEHESDRSTPDERHEEGRAARKVAARSSHAEWSPSADRRDPVEVITDQDATRLKWLVPIRHQRMGESSLAFCGGAAIMAADLASTPVSGLKATAKLTERADRALRIADPPPLLVSLSNLPDDDVDQLHHLARRNGIGDVLTCRGYRLVMTDDMVKTPSTCVSAIVEPRLRAETVR